ncbi:hypothetical protein OAQ45_00290 [Candidatus Marinimicrobia bacterium]|nr:hypothetical protein [Candidatus Neomarinimicrobiota bacterium]
MAVSKAGQQVTFSSANSVAVSADSQTTSDAIALSSNSVAAQITLKSDHSGSPSSGDTVDFYILYSTGDPDGLTTDEFDTSGHALHLAILDLNIEDPAQKTVDIPVSAKSFKIYIDNNGSLSITCSAEIYETIVS